MIMGWAHKTNPADILQIWGYFAEAEDIDEQRADLNEAMEAWSDMTGKKIYKNIAFSEETMKEIMKPLPSLGSWLADYETCDRGETPVCCIPVSASKQIAAQYYKEAKKMIQAQGN